MNLYIEKAKVFYRKNFAKYFIFRIIRNLIKNDFDAIIIELRNKSPVYFLDLYPKFFKHSFHKKISFSDFISVNKISAQVLFDEYQYNPRPFTSIPERYQNEYNISFDELTFPQVLTFEIQNCFLLGGADLIFTDSECIHSNFINWNREELYPVSNAIIWDSGKGILVRNRSKSLEIDSAIHLINGLNGNYAHFLLETLPKLSGLICMGVYKNQPILIDEGLHENIYEAIQLLTGFSGRIIKVAKGEMVICKKLVVFTPTARIIYNHKNINLSDPLVFSDSFYNLNAIKSMSKHVLNVIATTNTISTLGQKKIFFCRGENQGRKVHNHRLLIQIFKDKGFEVYNPNDLSFKEQIHILSGCNFFVTQTGAALSSLIFLKPKTKILTFAGWPGNAGNCHFFINLRDDLAGDINFVMFEPDPNSQSLVHKDFFVDIQFMDNLLDSY
ncbi:glycosyltransferase family 61 protein [Polynucleobacter sp. AP-Capit-er-40B-B4]|uniref:glycosyltransferase family 61 protein n=1 Tax=Polynucleobacter sp. AP-Capit-er-40B-B4 TaxID=2576927 RepID=UPI001C0DA19D|nr:glycosyltransferase family 61 protein [Polynucleobacter sp. AP-Capit-er-40B-B4]MBU3580970.1 glycosyltransferase family 61 protein [Polynucleobacter sp. AP-Capit-er-40B-B4]